MFQLQAKWEARATVRSRPYISFDTNGAGYFYPISRQPIAVHPKILEKGDDALKYLLIQSLYKYSNDISSIETRIVNTTILKVISGQLDLEFSDEQKLNLYTIMVDEAYHAYVAYDSLLQIEKETGVKSLPLPKTIEIERAIRIAKEKLPIKYHDVFELICVCLAENTLTKEIVTMTDKDETHPFFQKIIKDHLSDETRHSGVFFHLLGHIWSKVDIDCKRNIGLVLVEFLDTYLGVSVQKEFDKQILLELNFSDLDADLILNDVYAGFSLTRNHPMLMNILNLLEKSGMRDEYISPSFKTRGWIL